MFPPQFSNPSNHSGYLPGLPPILISFFSHHSASYCLLVVSSSSSFCVHSRTTAQSLSAIGPMQEHNDICIDSFSWRLITQLVALLPMMLMTRVQSSVLICIWKLIFFPFPILKAKKNGTQTSIGDWV